MGNHRSGRQTAHSNDEQENNNAALLGTVISVFLDIQPGTAT